MDVLPCRQQPHEGTAQRTAVGCPDVTAAVGLEVGLDLFGLLQHGGKFGLCVNFGTVNRIAEALGVEPIVALKSKKKADKNLIDYVMTVIVEFARRHDLTIREASNYIRRFKGIDFLTEFYDVEHTLSFNDCVDDLTIVCQNNGGTLR